MTSALFAIAVMASFVSGALSMLAALIWFGKGAAKKVLAPDRRP